MSNEKLFGQILRRLDILIILQLETISGTESVSISSKVLKLSEFGLSASEIANIIGKPANYVTAILSKKRKKRDKRR